MAAAESLIIGAGGVALVGSFKEAEGFPPNGASIIAATAVLAFLASATESTILKKPVHALAALMLLVSVYTYVPKLVSNKKGKTHG